MPDSKLTLLPDQQWAFEAMQRFCKDSEARVFILSGYAGTGKTTLLRAFIEWLESEQYDNSTQLTQVERNNSAHQYVPLASTGRAAKVLGDKTGQGATTIHSWIYNFKGFNQDIEKMVEEIDANQGVDKTGRLLISFTLQSLESIDTHSLYIIDEASMVSDKRSENPTQAEFGSGRLLNDLFHFDPFGKFVFVGDNCQLPPVNGDALSPALSADYIAHHFFMKTASAKLTDIVRQEDGNDIIIASERMRQLCANPPAVEWGRFPFRGYEHIKIVPDQHLLVAQYVAEVKNSSYNGTTLIVGSNKQSNELSQIVRSQLGFTDPRLMVGELLLVMQNNLPTHLMNGDLVRVKSIGERRRAANLTFVSVEVEETVTGKVFTTMLIEDLLYSSATNLTQYQQKGLYIDFYRREKKQGVKPKSDQFSKDLMNDPLLNALRCSYGYAITCHKAQGGEWQEVYLDIPRYLSHQPGRSAYQWLYTAMTRASQNLHVTDGYFIA